MHADVRVGFSDAATSAQGIQHVSGYGKAVLLTAVKEAAVLFAGKQSPAIRFL